MQPRLADSSTPFRARASSTPYLRTKEEFSLVLPETQFGASAGASLQVVGLGGLFCHDSLFFRGLCETPQVNESALFRHPVVKAGVLVQWQGYAEVRFRGLFVCYVLFLSLFTAWTLAETRGAVVGSTWLRRLRIGTTFFALCFLALEVKQLIRMRFRTYWKDFWNKMAVFTYLCTCGAVALSDPAFTNGRDLGTLAKTTRSFAACAVWVQLFAYLRGFESCAPYERMLREIISDLRVFLMMYVIIICAFAHAILVYDDEAFRDKSVAETVAEVVKRFFATYRMGTLGDFEASDFVEQWQLHLLFNLCTLMITVILLNVLIAVISDTFDRLLERSESSLVRSRAQLIAEIKSIFGPFHPADYNVISQTQEEETDEWSGRVGALKKALQEMEERSRKKTEEMQEMMAKMQEEMMAKMTQIEERSQAQLLERIEKLVMTLREEQRT